MKETMAQKLKKLENKVVELEDENESLWWLLSEIEASNLTNPEYKTLFDEAFKKAHFQSLMSTKTPQEA